MAIESKNIRINSAYAALMRHVEKADKYESIVIVGIVKDTRDKDVSVYGGDIHFQLAASVIQALSVEVAVGRVKL